MGSNMSGAFKPTVEKIYDVALTSIGVTSPTSPDCEVLAKDSEDDNVYGRFVLKRDRIIGGLLLGHTRDADRIETLVRTEANVADIKERLLTGLV